MVEYLKQMTSVVSEAGDGELANQALLAILTEIKGKEALIASDQKLSKVLERLIESDSSTASVVRPLLEQLTPFVSEIAYDQYGSHVLESLLKAAARVSEDDGVQKAMTAFSETLSADLFNLISDRRATFVIRRAMVVFSGLNLGEGDILQEIMKAEPSKCKFSGDLSSLIEAVARLDGPSLDSLASEPHSSVTIQVLLLVGSRNQSEAAAKLISSILGPYGEVAAAQRIKSYLENSITAKLLETTMSVIPSSVVARKILDDIIDPRDIICSVDGEEVINEKADGLTSFLSHKFSFGFLQAFVSSFKDVNLATEFVSRVLTPHRMRLLAINGGAHGIGVLLKTAEALVQLVPPQTIFFKNLCEALNSQSDSIWMAILSMSFDSGKSQQTFDERSMTSQGCLMMSTLFRFKVSSVQPIVSNAKPLLDHLNNKDLNTSRFMTDVGCGRMLQTLISTESCVPSNMKAKIIRQLLLGDDPVARLEKLVYDRKVGSWLVTTAWDSADLQTKKLIGESLLKIRGLREGNWKVWTHCRLSTFARRNDEWEQTENRKSKAKDYLREIVGSHGTAPKKGRY